MGPQSPPALGVQPVDPPWTRVWCGGALSTSGDHPGQMSDPTSSAQHSARHVVLGAIMNTTTVRVSSPAFSVSMRSEMGLHSSSSSEILENCWSDTVAGWYIC